MENSVKSVQTSKKGTLYLILFIIVLLVGLGLIITGFVMNKSMRDSFVPPLDNPKAKYQPGWYIYLLEIGGAAIFLLSFGYLYSFLQIKLNLKKMTIKQMAVIAIFSALSVILYYFAKFNLPIFPSWLDIQFSDVPALFVTFMYGPFSGALTIIVRFFCKLPGTSTVGVGELADVLIGLTLCFVAGFIYKKHRTIKGALCALAIGMASATVMAMVANWLILIPAYKEIAGFPQVALTSTMDKILGGQHIVTDSNFMVYYLFVGVLPFNLFRYVLVFAITMILYKRLKSLIVHFVGDYDRDENVSIEDEPEELTEAIE
ncbi:MAG: ECF transporter S component [Acholeplasmatales bacterium]|nr:ECF transporter S component [Acholeplasmatales bacterium]